MQAMVGELLIEGIHEAEQTGKYPFEQLTIAGYSPITVALLVQNNEWSAMLFRQALKYQQQSLLLARDPIGTSPLCRALLSSETVPLALETIHVLGQIQSGTNNKDEPLEIIDQLFSTASPYDNNRISYSFVSLAIALSLTNKVRAPLHALLAMTGQSAERFRQTLTGSSSEISQQIVSLRDHGPKFFANIDNARISTLLQQLCEAPSEAGVEAQATRKLTR